MTKHALRCRAHDIATCPRFVSYVDDLVAGRTPPALGQFDDVLPGSVGTHR